MLYHLNISTSSGNRLNFTPKSRCLIFFSTNCRTVTVSLLNSFHRLFSLLLSWLIWGSVNGAGHINEVELRRARLVLQGIGDHLWLVYHSVFYRPLRPTQPGHPSAGSWRWFRPLLGKKRRVLRSSGPCYQHSWHTSLLYASLVGSIPSPAQMSKGMSSLATDLMVYEKILIYLNPSFESVYHSRCYSAEH